MTQGWVLPTIAATLVYGVWGLLPKFSTRYIETASSFVYTSCGLLTVGLGVLVYLGFKPEVNATGIIIAAATGVIGFSGTCTYILAAHRGPVTLVSVVTSLYLVPTILLAFLWFGETPTMLQALGLVLSVPAIILLVE